MHYNYKHNKINMNTKEVKIVPPEGYEIDVLNSNLECIKFKPIEKKKWREDRFAIIKGYVIEGEYIMPYEKLYNVSSNYNVFATEKQAKSALAMARISQIMDNDKRFGGVVTYKEWNNGEILKYYLYRNGTSIGKDEFYYKYNFISFHTAKQRNLFLEENEDLVKDYLMID